jgi:hypothetical protein
MKHENSCAVRIDQHLAARISDLCALWGAINQATTLMTTLAVLIVFAFAEIVIQPALPAIYE